MIYKYEILKSRSNDLKYEILFYICKSFELDLWYMFLLFEWTILYNENFIYF